MQVSIKDLAVNMDVGSKGIEFGVHDTKGKHQGDFYVTMTGIEWCAGKVPKGSGVKWDWAKVMASMV